MQQQALPVLTIDGANNQLPAECAQVCNLLAGSNDADAVAHQIIRDAYNRFGFGEVTALLDKFAA